VNIYSSLKKVHQIISSEERDSQQLLSPSSDVLQAALTSPASTNIDENRMRRIEHFFAPILRIQSHHVGRKRIGSADAALQQRTDDKECTNNRLHG